MNTAVYFLRAKQMGLTLEEMEQMTAGFVIDLITENVNDEAKYSEKATQADFNNF